MAGETHEQIILLASFQQQNPDSNVLQDGTELLEILSNGKRRLAIAVPRPVSGVEAGVPITVPGLNMAEGVATDDPSDVSILSAMHEKLVATEDPIVFQEPRATRT